MKLWRIFLASCCFLFLNTASYAVTIKEITTASGIKAWLVEDHTVPLVNVSSAFAQGSIDDPDTQKGISLLLSGLVDEGAGTLSGEAFRSRTEDIGMRMYSDSSWDNFSFAFSFPTASLDEGAELTGLALSSLSFPEEAVERMRKQFLTYIASADRSPESLANRLFINKLMPGHPYAKADVGMLETMRKISRADLVAAHKRIFSRKDLKIGIAGDVTEEEAKLLLETVYGKLPEGPGSRVVPTVKITAKSSVEVIPFNTPQTLMIFGGVGIPTSDLDYAASSVAISILSATFTDLLRGQRGLTYDVTYDDQQSEASSLTIGSFRTANQTADDALQAVKEAMALALLNVREQNVENTVRYLKGSIAMGVETDGQLAALLLNTQLSGFSSNYLSMQEAILDRVKLADVRRVIERLADPDHLVVVAVGQPEGLGQQ
jgi:zinc protease